MVTPMCTQLTYEGLLDEVSNYMNGIFHASNNLIKA